MNAKLSGASSAQWAWVLGVSPVTFGKRRHREAAEPLMKYLAEKHNPHCTVIVTNMWAELVEGMCSLKTEKFLHCRRPTADDHDQAAEKES